MADTSWTGMVIREYITPGLIGLALGGSLYYAGSKLIRESSTPACDNETQTAFASAAQGLHVAKATVTLTNGQECRLTFQP